MSKIVAIIVPPKAVSDMTLLKNELSAFGIILSVHTPQRFDRASLYGSLLEAKSRNTDAIISMLPLPFEREIVGNTFLPALELDKFTQFQMFKENLIPTLTTMPFKFGMKFPGTPLDIVTLKPSILDTSLPSSMLTLRNGVLHQLVPRHFEQDHPIHKHPYVVQEFIETGTKPTSFRVILFCGVPIMSYRIVSRRERPNLGNNQVHVGPEFISNNDVFGWDARLEANPEMIKWSVAMSFSVGHSPLAKCDLLYSADKGWRALEVSGNDFNGWPLGRKTLIQSLGREAMIKQFDMFKVMSKKISEVVNWVR